MPETGDVDLCIHCNEAIKFEYTIAGEWSHWHGDTWCHDKNGFTKTPLNRATALVETTNDGETDAR